MIEMPDKRAESSAKQYEEDESKSKSETKSVCINNPIDKIYYNEKVKIIYNYYKDKKKHPKPFLLPRHKLIEKLHNKVENTGFVFIESPLLKGKTTLLNNYENWLNKSDKYHTNQNGDKRSNDPKIKDIYIYDILSKYVVEDIFTINDLYQVWGKSLLVQLFNKGLLNDDKLTDGHRKLVYGSKNFFLDKIKNLYEENDYIAFAAFLEIIQLFITKYSNNRLIVFFLIRLEDFHKHIENDKIYTLFANDIYKYTSDLDYKIDVLERIKLLVTTRVFPTKRPSRIVFYINNFNKSETFEFIRSSLKLSDDCSAEISKLVYESTSGHPWFFNRFLELFSILYLEEQQEPIKIVKAIFSNKEYWMKNNIFKRKENSEYLRALRLIFNQSNIDSNTLSFLNEMSYTDGSFEKYKQNSLIQEMGLINFKVDEEEMIFDILGFGNEIIKDFFIKEL